MEYVVVLTEKKAPFGGLSKGILSDTDTTKEMDGIQGHFTKKLNNML
jgi:hypothetical protein